MMKSIWKLMLLSALTATGVFAKQPLPNIVYILADDMGVGDVAALNPGAKVKTPNIDGLVAGGMQFSDAHSASAVCTPTRYSLMTGRYSWRSEKKERVLHGYSRSLIKPDRDTVASLLKRNGYATAMIGKWHLGLNWMLKDGTRVSELDSNSSDIEPLVDFTKPFTGGPCDFGFDSWYGINASLDFPPYTWLVNDRASVLPTEQNPFKHDKTPAGKQRMMRGGLMAPGFDPSLLLKQLTERAVDYIGNVDSAKPFYFYMALNAPHTPVMPREEFLGKSGCGIYGDFIQEIDWTVGQVVAALKKKGLLKNTLVIFTADNGASRISFPVEFEEQYGHHSSAIYKGRKGSLNEGGHRVPFVAQWPAVIPAGSRSDVMCGLTDLYATCADLVGEKVAPNAGEDSYSMLPLFFQTPGKYKRTNAVHHDFGGRFAFRDGKWKLIPNKSPKKAALYDLEADVSETTNLHGKYPEVVEQLEKSLTEVVSNGRSTPGPKQQNDAPEWWPQLIWMDEK
ncbi:sulfatase family protein [Pontiella sulfatireligans]|uniref:Arylsulfatase n=1 Tax=Pontiella sulfatireligans TaxID=2750658 RepID=A0A6C2UEL3_9BACT|nr:arylsulfatase [Pontiella sulfatireligans]SPS74199.1 sulfatase S1_15 [Kiritimatiellales bacterium]VGO18595.1 Arylsulfatase [Pontiella sulfatireligans]